MATEVVIYADESAASGEHYSNFYGGAAVLSGDLAEVERRLKECKASEHLHGEVKWGKVTANYLGKYLAFVNTTFGLVREEKLRLRIMFTHNYRRATNLDEYQKANAYFLLYYQFIKHAFGLQYLEHEEPEMRLRIYLDNLPDTTAKRRVFKAYLEGLADYPPFKQSGIRISGDQIAEVKSHDHVVLQALDVILGSMQFRLNDWHLVKAPGTTRRGKRTLAKGKLYQEINRQIRTVYPNFNIGVSTGIKGEVSNRWRHPYRHWCFVPSEFEIDESKAKQKPRSR